MLGRKVQNRCTMIYIIPYCWAHRLCPLFSMIYNMAMNISHARSCSFHLLKPHFHHWKRPAQWVLCGQIQWTLMHLWLTWPVSCTGQLLLNTLFPTWLLWHILSWFNWSRSSSLFFFHKYHPSSSLALVPPTFVCSSVSFLCMFALGSLSIPVASPAIYMLIPDSVCLVLTCRLIKQRSCYKSYLF